MDASPGFSPQILALLKTKRESDAEQYRLIQPLRPDA